MYSPSAWWYTMDNNTFAASHGGKNPCAQISSNIEDHSPFWSHGQGMKHCTPSFLSFAFECARYWLHKFGLYRLQQRLEYLWLKLSNYKSYYHNQYIKICFQLSMPSKRRLYTTFSIHIFLLYIASTRLSRQNATNVMV